MKYPDDYIDHIICGDFLELSRNIPDESVDMIFADPPFNIGKKYKRFPDDYYRDAREDYKEWCEEWVKACFRVLKPAGSFYLMTLTRHLEWKMPIMAQHGVFINLISWRNVSALHSKRQFLPEYQPIMLYGKTQDYVFNTYAELDYRTWDRWGGYSTGPRHQIKDRWNDIAFVYAGSIAHPEAILTPGKNSKIHPCQMPVALAERAMRFSTNQGGVVLDPFAGVGTTAVAAVNLKRKYICVDVSKVYCDIAVNRVTQERKQLRFW